MTAEPAPRPPLWAVAALAASSVAVLLSAPAQYLGRQQDDLLYVISSQALARGGYSLFTAVGRPPLLMITPGWPALLLPFSLLSPDSLGVYEAWCALLAAALPWALFGWLRRRCGDLSAAAIAALCATSPLMLSQAGAVMSEVPYLWLTLGLFWTLERSRRPGAAWACGGWLLALTQTRPAALSLLPAALAGFWRERRWKELAQACALPAAGAAAWCGWSYALANSVQEVDEFRLSYAGSSWTRPLAVAADNARFYAASWGASVLPDRWAGGPAASAAGAVLLLSAAAGCWKALRRRPDEPAAWLALGAAGMHAVWAWQYERYLIPVLPFLWWAAWLAWGRAAKPALLGLLACQLIFQTPHWLGGTNWRRPELEKTYAWLSSRMGAGEALASQLYVRDGFYTGRPSLPVPDAATAAEFSQRLKAQRARWVLWQGRVDVGLSQAKSAEIRRRLDRAAARLEDESVFKRVYENHDENSRVFVLR